MYTLSNMAVQQRHIRLLLLLLFFRHSLGTTEQREITINVTFVRCSISDLHLNLEKISRFGLILFRQYAV